MEDTNVTKSGFSKVRFFIVLFLVLVGIAICFDLGWIFYKTNFMDVFKPSFCSVNSFVDCDGVALTHYSLSFGVPNALWGLFVYSILLMLLFVDKIQNKFKNTIFDVFENPRSYIATISFLTFSLSMILAYISIAKIHKICALCFCTYFVDLFISLISMSGLKEGFIFKDIKITIVDFIKGAKKYFVLFLVSLCAFVGTLYYLNDSYIMSPKLRKQKLQAEFFEAKTNKYAVKGNTLGKENAKVVINIYSDFNCPFCRVINIMLHKIAKEGHVLIVDKHYPLDSACNSRVGMTLGGHENSCLEAKYALAAKKQGKYWGVADVFFYQMPKNEADIIDMLQKSNLKLDMEKLKNDANSAEIESQLSEDIKAAQELGINGTPSLQINDTLYVGGMTSDELEEKIKLAEKRTKN